MAQQRVVPPRLSLPPHPQLSKSSTARLYPVFTPTPSNNGLIFSPSSTPTPSKRSRAPHGPLWFFTILHLFSLYLLHQWLSTFPMPPPLAIFTSFVLFMAALSLNIIYRPWKGRQILSSQWGLLLISGSFLGLSYYLCFQGLQLSGPLETIFADFAGSLVVKVLLDSPIKRSETARKALGLVALLLGVFLLSHGWARMSCSPLAIDVSYTTHLKITEQSKDCVKLWSGLAPLLGGVLSALHRMIGAKTALKSIGKKRVQVLSYAMGSLALFPFALFQLAFVSGQSTVQFGSSFWLVASVVAFGMVISFFSEFYTEEKLFIPVHSLKAFQVLTCVVCGLELLYGLSISLAGFLFCSLVLGIGVQELALLQGQLSWEELGDTSYGSLVFAPWTSRPLQHIMSDKKSRKIAIFLLINTGFMFVEFFYGFLSNSLGLISDACHMLFDCAALAIGLYASYISRLPENSKFNYGYGRFEVVSGYANAVLLVLVASLIVLESIERILEPPEISTESLLVVSVGGLLVNIVGLIFFHEEHHHAHGHGAHSCSHSHSSHKSLHSSESTSKDTKVDFSAISSDGSSHLPFIRADSSSHLPFPSHHHSSSTWDNGNGFATIGAVQGHHESHDVCDHDHHHCQSHSPDNSNSYHEAHKHEGHGDHDLNHQHKDGQQCLSEHNHSHHHHNHDDHYHCHHGHASPHQEPLDHSHACSSGHAHHKSEGHNCVNHREQHNHGNKDVEHDHIHHDDRHEHHHKHGHHDDNDNHSHDHHDHMDHNHSHDHHHHMDHNHSHDDIDNHSHDHHDHMDHNHSHDDNDNDNHSHDDHHHMDHNMYGIFLHVLADTLGSVGVVISTLLIKYKGWLITDPACSIFLSALIIGSVVPLLRNSAEILLQRVPRHNERSLKAAMKRVAGLAGVQSVNRAHVWSFTNTEIVGSLHVQLLAGSDRKLVQAKTLGILHEAGIGNLTLQIEEAS